MLPMREIPSAFVTEIGAFLVKTTRQNILKVIKYTLMFILILTLLIVVSSIWQCSSLVMDDILERATTFLKIGTF